MLKIEIKSDNGTVIRPLTNKDCDAVVSFYLSENKIEIKQCEISFAAVDEFQEFVNCLQNLEINNPTIVAQFKESLTPQEVVALKELVHVRKIKVTYNNTTLNVPRRTVRIKRAPKA